MLDIRRFTYLTIYVNLALIPISCFGYTNTNEIQELTERLFHACEPNLMPYINVHLQHRTSSWSHADDAPAPLFTVNEAIFDRIPTIAKLRRLFDNYEINSATDETTTPVEANEIHDFINTLLDTPVMQIAMDFLQSKGVVTTTRESHYNLLRRVWFDMYARSHDGHVGSSGFEHTFLGELKHGSPMGLHNWIYYSMQEKRPSGSHHINYMGYMGSLQLGDKAQIIKYRLNFDEHDKPVNSMFVGTLPEFEIALYTVCLETCGNNCEVSLGGNPVTIRTFPFYYGHSRMLGSAYPVI